MKSVIAGFKNLSFSLGVLINPNPNISVDSSVSHLEPQIQITSGINVECSCLWELWDSEWEQQERHHCNCTGNQGKPGVCQHLPTAPSAAPAPVQGQFQSWCCGFLRPWAFAGLKTLWGSLGYVVDLWNFAAVIEVRGDEHLAGSGLEKNVLPSAAVPPFVAQDLSGL